MGEAVKMISCFPGMGVPVVEKQVMKKAGPGRFAVIPAKPPANMIAQIRNLKTVGLATRRPVLDKVFHRLENGMF